MWSSTDFRKYWSDPENRRKQSIRQKRAWLKLNRTDYKIRSLKSRHLTMIYIRKILRKVNPNVTILAKEYSNSYVILSVRCKKCKRIWKALWNALSRGSGCPKCKYDNMRLSLRSIRKINPNIIVLSSKYVNSYTPLRLKCKKCKKIWKAIVYSLYHSNSCPICRYNHRRLTLAEVKLRIKRINPSIKVVSRKYVRSDVPLKLKCRKCKAFWKATWRDLSQNHCSICHSCYRNVSEKRVIDIIERITRHKFFKSNPEWLRGRNGHKLELDGYSKKLKVAIEYQGEQRYKRYHRFALRLYKNDKKKIIELKKRDERKRVLCYNNDVTLIRVPYWKLRKGNDVVENFIKAKLRKAGLLT